MTPWKVGLGVFVLGTMAFALWTWAVLGRQWTADWDQAWARDMRACAEKQPTLRNGMAALTLIGSVTGLTTVATLGALWQWTRRRRWLAVCWPAAALAGSLINLGLKTTLDRDRPPQEWRDPAVFEDNESYPSGHSMGGTIGLGLLAYALCLELRRVPARILVVIGLALFEVVIGFSRIYLRAHWFSDVIGGFTLGLAWLALCVGLLETYRRKSEQPRLEVDKSLTPDQAV